MASNKIETDGFLIKELCSITGVSRLVATNLLEACDNNLEMAVNMHMEGGIAESNGTSSSTLDDDVRAPIPQRQEVLIDGPDQLSYSFRGRSRISHSVFDKFRDFEAETRRQEEELLEESSSSSTESVIQKRRKMKTLEDLFRPPLELLFRGSFQSARDAAVSCRKWLIVNVQNSSEFPCQVLNRDVWSNSAVKTIIQEHFIFWQIYHDSEDGLRFMNFYPVNEWPYIAIIDPRTGEKLVQWQKMDAVAFCDLITEFLSTHPPLDDGCGSSSTSTNTPPRKKQKLNDSIIEADEQSQIEAAIKASLEGTAPSSNATFNGDSDDLETFDSDSDDVKEIGSDSSKFCSETKLISSDPVETSKISSAKTSETTSETSIPSGKAKLSKSANSKFSKNTSKTSTFSSKTSGTSKLSSETCGTSEISSKTSKLSSKTSGTSKLSSETCGTSEISSEAKDNGVDVENDKTSSQRLDGSSEESVGSCNAVEDVKDNGGDECDEIEDLDSEKETWEMYLGNKADAVSNLILRLPDASREVLKMPSTSKLMALVLYVGSKGFSNESYELVTNFPRRNLSNLDFQMSLKAAGLFPQETVFIQKR